MRGERRVAHEGEDGQGERLQPWRWTARSAAACACRSGRRRGRPTARGRSTGPNWQAASSPRARPLSVSRSTSSVWATIVSQLPTWEISWPPKNSRKLRTRSDRNVSLVARPRALTGRASRDSLEDVEGVGQTVELSAAEARDAPGEPDVLALAGPHDEITALGRRVTRTTRRSVGSGRRWTLPSASSRATTPVTVGGATPSWAASSPSVSDPCRSMATRAESWLGDRPESACWRNVRWRRATATAEATRHLLGPTGRARSAGGDRGDPVRTAGRRSLRHDR